MNRGGAPGGRAPLPAAELRQAAVRPGGLWTELTVLAETGSTNTEVAAAARDGTAEGLVVVAEHQTAGRGRAGRTWQAPPRAGLAVSLLLRPAAPSPRWGWLPLLAGVALAESVAAVTGVDARLKWPNDLLVGGHKCAGILAEVVGSAAVVGSAVVVGVGLNVTQQAAELPRPDATSLVLAGASSTDRSALLLALLSAVDQWYARWCASDGDSAACGLHAAYLDRCGTLGEPVRAVLPDRTELTGTAETVDPDGRLVLRTPTGTHLLMAGDVTNLRHPHTRPG